ncbi:MAG: hypothetical protein HY689_08575, partial [Chloroflexi bacterium]|nr:hypothetical protein [Chloroflexota bacterium]
MATALLWWAALQALSLATVPLARLLFRSLPDRGYAFTKVLGPLLLAVLLWWSGSLSLLPNQRGTVLLLAYALVLGGLAGLGLLRREGAALPRRMLLAVVLTEVVFGATFAFWAVVRAYSPEIDGTEKPMDFAFLNASYRSRTFPPEDPWLSGFPIRYYYLGYLNAAALTRLVDVPTAVGYNLALATLAAQAATAACGLAYNLAEGVRRATSRPVGPLLAGLLAAVLLVGVGNLEGMLELVRARGWGSDALWSWVDVQDLQATAPSDRWYPTDAWFWWRATRIIHTHVDGQSLDYTITEFPFFSFLLGDLHPHVMALPLVLTALGMALQVLLDPQPPQASLRQPLAVLGPGALLGALGFTNIWDLPTLGAVILVAGGLRWIAVPVWPALARMARWRISQTMHLAAQVPAWSASDRVVHWVAWASAVGACAFLLYAPFFGGLVGTGHAALGPERNGPPVALWIGPGSRPLHLLLLWTPFLLASGLFLWGLAGRLSPRPRTAARAALLAPLVLWVTLEMLAYPGADPHSPLVVVWPKLWALGPLAVALALLRTEVQGLRTDHQALSPQSPALSPNKEGLLIPRTKEPLVIPPRFGRGARVGGPRPSRAATGAPG